MAALVAKFDVGQAKPVASQPRQSIASVARLPETPRRGKAAPIAANRHSATALKLQPNEDENDWEQF
jgi:hypothetical protein